MILSGFQFFFFFRCREQPQLQPGASQRPPFLRCELPTRPERVVPCTQKEFSGLTPPSWSEPKSALHPFLHSPSLAILTSQPLCPIIFCSRYQQLHGARPSLTWSPFLLAFLTKGCFQFNVCLLSPSEGLFFLFVPSLFCFGYLQFSLQGNLSPT